MRPRGGIAGETPLAKVRRAAAPATADGTDEVATKEAGAVHFKRLIRRRIARSGRSVDLVADVNVDVSVNAGGSRERPPSRPASGRGATTTRSGKERP
jgi:hypothetical protein